MAKFIAAFENAKSSTTRPTRTRNLRQAYTGACILLQLPLALLYHRHLGFHTRCAVIVQRGRMQVLCNYPRFRQIFFNVATVLFSTFWAFWLPFDFRTTRGKLLWKRRLAARLCLFNQPWTGDCLHTYTCPH
jgi:hypothetical protein